jgi:hypothetical protein
VALAQPGVELYNPTGLRPPQNVRGPRGGATTKLLLSGRGRPINLAARARTPLRTPAIRR